MEYEEFLKRKELVDEPSGFDVAGFKLTNGGDRSLFPFQEAIVRWALKRGRAAVFADTGLGKTAIQSAWAYAVHKYTGNRVLILAPLCVAPQTVLEADHFGIPIRYARDFEADGSTGIYITNYEMLEKFTPWFEKGYFDGVVLDESSIIKHETSKTRNRLIEACRKLPFRLSCTATPSPNDYMELGNQAEFLGAMGMQEMLAMFFTHDSGQTSKWRLKGHGRTRFWEWLSHWAVFIKKPSDLGYEDQGYDLPKLDLADHVIQTGKPVAMTLSERLQARRESIDARVARCAELVNASRGPFIVWCNLNEESGKLTDAIEGAVEVRGSLDLEEKELRIRAFTNGEARVLVTKPSITGYGLNWQHCAQMAFVGLNDSYEDLYQAIRRCYRFGQKKPVQVHLISADSEGAVLENIKWKEAQAAEMSAAMVSHMREFSERQVKQMERERTEYRPKLRLVVPEWLHV